MGEKKKRNANTTALIGAAFLMATSAIGPGFLTQTATFTGQYGSIFRTGNHLYHSSGCYNPVKYLVHHRCVRYAWTGYRK